MLLWVWKLLISPNIYGWFHTETVTNTCRSMVPSKLSYRPGLPQVVGTQGKQGTSQWSTGHDLWPHRNWWTQRLRRKRRSRRSCKADFGMMVHIQGWCAWSGRWWKTALAEAPEIQRLLQLRQRSVIPFGCKNPSRNPPVRRHWPRRLIALERWRLASCVNKNGLFKNSIYHIYIIYIYSIYIYI